MWCSYFNTNDVLRTCCIRSIPVIRCCCVQVDSDSSASVVISFHSWLISRAASSPATHYLSLVRWPTSGWPRQPIRPHRGASSKPTSLQFALFFSGFFFKPAWCWLVAGKQFFQFYTVRRWWFVVWVQSSSQSRMNGDWVRDTPIFFVAIINNGHIIRTQQQQQEAAAEPAAEPPPPPATCWCEVKQKYYIYMYRSNNYYSSSNSSHLSVSATHYIHTRCSGCRSLRE